jgi:hypothetical protein
MKNNASEMDTPFLNISAKKDFSPSSLLSFKHWL